MRVHPEGFLSRLARDTRGNALAIMAAFLIPLCAFSGSAIDMARLYTVKVRLQQACDAGALAGRKSMDANNNIDTSSTGQAQTFFKNNFQSGWFKATNVSFTPSVTSDYQVAGTASASVPMTIMSMFGQPTRTITVNCQARYDVADADIMFVLDTTGSMACTTADDNGNGCGAPSKAYTRNDGTTGYYTVEEGGSKISGLRSAVLTFYDTLASSADSSTHIRYGFVPYTSSVNVGTAIAPMASSVLVPWWQYQTRHAIGDNILSSDAGTVVTAQSAADCATKGSRSPALTTATNPKDGSSVQVYAYDSTGRATRKDPKYAQDSKGNWVCTVYTESVSPIWRYQQWPVDVRGFGAGNTVDDPSKTSSATSTWQGCIEETNTTASSSFDQTNLPPDLNPDLIPSASVNSWGFPTSQDTRWRPMWPDVTYYRNTVVGSDDDYGYWVDYSSPYRAWLRRYGMFNNPYGDYDPSIMSYYGAVGWAYSNMLHVNNYSSGYYTCGMPSQRLKVMTRDQVSAYVNNNDFRAIGGTYHDTGMIWGTRFIAPNGLFASDTTAWPGRQSPNRYIVFMTDGAMSPNQSIYGMYGIEQYDGRVTGQTGSSYSASTDLNNHNARFVAECQAAKNRNITVFVVGFGQTLNDQLTACASPGQAYYASDNTSLKAAFQKIAQQVAMLRISK